MNVRAKCRRGDVVFERHAVFTFNLYFLIDDRGYAVRERTEVSIDPRNAPGYDVRVNVDEAGSNVQSGRVDDLACR